LISSLFQQFNSDFKFKGRCKKVLLQSFRPRAVNISFLQLIKNEKK
jgi:hypothetical protein